MVSRRLRPFTLTAMLLVSACGPAPAPASVPLGEAAPAALPSAHAARVEPSPAPAPASAPSPPAEADLASEPLPPSRPGPCPPPSPATQALFNRAAKLSASTGARSADEAVAEAIRERLDELYQSGCRSSLDDAALVAEVLRLREAPEGTPSLFGESLGPRTVMFGHGGPQGDAVSMFTFREGKVRTRITVTSEGPEMERTLMLLDASLFQPPGAPEPLLAVASSHPWMSSCWRSLRFRVLAASGTPARPTALLDQPASGRWCEGVSIETREDEVQFLYDGWGGPLRFGDVQRPRASTHRWDGAGLVRHFGFAGTFHQLVDDWLAAPWSLAIEATQTSEAARLAPIHEDLFARTERLEHEEGSAARPTFSFELFPAGEPTRRRLVVYCALDEGGKPCGDWPRPIDFTLVQEGEHWLVADVKRRPSGGRDVPAQR